MRASGTRGELRVGYQYAATLGAWTLEMAARIPVTFILRAQLLHEHEYWSQQAPLDLVLDLAGVEWIWHGVRVQRDGKDVLIEVTKRPIVEQRSAASSDATREGA